MYTIIIMQNFSKLKYKQKNFCVNFKVFFATFTGHWNFSALLNVKLFHTFQARWVQLICTVNHKIKCSVRNLGIFTWFLPGTCIPQLFWGDKFLKRKTSPKHYTYNSMHHGGHILELISNWTRCVFLCSHFLSFLQYHAPHGWVVVKMLADESKWIFFYCFCGIYCPSLVNNEGELKISPFHPSVHWSISLCGVLITSKISEGTDFHFGGCLHLGVRKAPVESCAVTSNTRWLLPCCIYFKFG